MSFITRNAPAMAAWIGLVAHVAVGLLAPRRPALLPLLNLAVAVCVLGYWAREWYFFLARGVTWYGSDQLIPLYALAVAVVSWLALAGRYDGRALHWIAFTVDALVLAVAVLYFTFVRFDRLF
jgi:hypothetical protein